MPFCRLGMIVKTACGATALSALPAIAQSNSAAPDNIYDLGWYIAEARINEPLEPGVIHTRDVVAGGSFDLSQLDSGCIGGRSEKMDVAFRIHESIGPFAIEATPVDGVYGDLTLALRDLDGNWHCDDDSGPGRDPRLHFSSAVPGNYAIFVGVFGGGEIPARLAIELDDPDPSSNPWDITAEDIENTVNFRRPRVETNGNMAPDDLTPRLQGFDDADVQLIIPYDGRGMTQIDVVAGGPVTSAVMNPGCRGFIAREADIAFTLHTPSPQLRVHAFTDVPDPTLMIKSSQGEPLCETIDTSHRNTTIEIPNVAAGDYLIYVGDMDERNEFRATVTISTQ